MRHVRQLATAGCAAAVVLLGAAAGVAAGSHPATGDRVPYTPAVLVLDGGRVHPVATLAALDDLLQRGACWMGRVGGLERGPKLRPHHAFAEARDVRVRALMNSI